MHSATRAMTRETHMSPSSLIYPIFVREGSGIKEEIPSMPGQYHHSVDTLACCLEEIAKAGVQNVMLFGIPEHKDANGSGAYDREGIVQKALREAKRTHPELFLIGDVCMCEYTSHGHCGILNGEEVDNDATLPYLARIALSQVQAGADMVAPSDMMDGRIAQIRRTLDQNGYAHIPILSYAAKYASSFYGPFRDAAQSAPQFGDRSSYQMDFHNRKEARKEVRLDIEEGADIVMVKPALAYLDVVREVADEVLLPVAAYSVSGEYSMIKMAAKAGVIDEKKMVCETATCIYRAGADILLTYYAKELAAYMKEGVIG